MDSFNNTTTLALLQASLSASIPLFAMEFQQRQFGELIDMAKECASIVAHKGDVILYRSKRKCETADAYNALAKGMAVLAFLPGGVKAFGLHFEYKHPELSSAHQKTEIVLAELDSIIDSLKQLTELIPALKGRL